MTTSTQRRKGTASDTVAASQPASAAQTPPATTNEEAIEAWDGPLFDRFVRFRHIVVTGLTAFGERALADWAPQRGDRVLDIGCGFGDTTQRIAAIVGPDGEAVGVDAAPRFIAAARDEAAAAGVVNASYHVADVEAGVPGERFDAAFSRFGTMFFANPVAALRNVRGALVPGGRLCMVVWRRKLENEWVHRAETVVERILERNEDSDEPTCGPGPFALADADVVTQILVVAGFDDVALRRCDIPIRIGADIEEAIACVCSLGPAGELIRLAGDEADRRRPEIDAALRTVLAAYERHDGVVAPASAWIVTARAASR